MSQFNTLRDLAIGKQEPQQKAEDVVGQSFIDEATQWEIENAHLSPDNKIEQFENDLGSRWQFTPNNKEHYWNTLGRLSSLSKNEFENFTKKDIRGQINKIQTTEAKENYFRDKAHTWPSYALKDLEQYFFNLRGLNDNKNLERNRITQTLEMRDLLKNKTFALNPQISLATHVEEMIKAYDSGYTTEIETDADGRIAVPLEGTMTPAFAFEEPAIPLEEKFVSLNDLTPAVEEAFRSSLKKAREEEEESEKLVKISLLNRAETGDLPEQFVHNAVIDGAAIHEKPAEKILSSAHAIILRETEGGAFETYGELARYWNSFYKTLGSKLERRLTHGIDS